MKKLMVLLALASSVGCGKQVILSSSKDVQSTWSNGYGILYLNDLDSNKVIEYIRSNKKTCTYTSALVKIDDNTGMIHLKDGPAECPDQTLFYDKKDLELNVCDGNACATYE